MKTTSGYFLSLKILFDFYRFVHSGKQNLTYGVFLYVEKGFGFDGHRLVSKGAKGGNDDFFCFLFHLLQDSSWIS